MEEKGASKPGHAPVGRNTSEQNLKKRGSIRVGKTGPVERGGVPQIRKAEDLGHEESPVVHDKNT